MSVAPAHEFVEHTADVELHLRAGSLAELLVEAGRALGALLLRGQPASATGPWRDVAVEAPDRGALLIDWLNELIYLAETEGFVALEFALSEASDTRLAGRVRGAVLPEPPVHVKAATFHGLRVAEIDGGIEANVILDV